MSFLVRCLKHIPYIYTYIYIHNPQNKIMNMGFEVGVQ